MDISSYVEKKAFLAKQASKRLNSISTKDKNEVLINMSKALINNKDKILYANELDVSEGKKRGMSNSLLDRLLLNEKRIVEMSEGLMQVAALPDPVGEVINMWKRPNGLLIGKVRVPIGVIGIIYEARPNVTVDAAALCIKSGNAVILKGGSEALNSNIAIAEILSKAAESNNLFKDCIQLIETADREAVKVMMKLNKYIDLLIPRGGANLIKAVVENSTVPVIETGVGNCHVYIDREADINMAENIVINAKTQRPGVCNAMETLLVHKDIADIILPELCEKLRTLGVEIRGCDKTQKLVPYAIPATEDDYINEFLDLILAVKVVNSIDEAIEHICKYGTKHSESIVTKDYFNAQKFLREVDAAAVYVNASTRFTDGYEFGFGSEIGISTQKIHARGPMGLNELTTTKYIIYGGGQIR